MTKKLEVARLKEIGRAYQNPPERVAVYNHRQVLLLAIGGFVGFIATLLAQLQAVSAVVCVAIAMVGGCVLGGSVWFSVAAKQIPLLVRYTALREEEIRKRIGELSANDENFK